MVPDDGRLSLVGNTNAFDGFARVALIFKFLDRLVNAGFNGGHQL